MTHLGNAYRALHGRSADQLRGYPLNAVGWYDPSGTNPCQSYLCPLASSCEPELSHYFTSRITISPPTSIFNIGQNIMLIPLKFNGFIERRCSIWINTNACFWKTLRKGCYGFDLLNTFKTPPFNLKPLKP